MFIQYQCRDSNPRPLEHEFLPITTRPGLPLAVQPIYNGESVMLIKHFQLRDARV